ncbi:MAG: ATP-binding protein [Caldilineaceae bacterium]|nr:ATP-binding protein [Caldilineaceae bacterium]
MMAPRSNPDSAGNSPSQQSLPVPYQSGQPAVSTPAGRPAVSRTSVMRLGLLTDSALKNGIHIVGGPGSGKSRYMGRVLTWQAFMRGIPVVVLDPTGGIIMNIMDKICRQPPEVRKKLWPRIDYDVSATDYVRSSPLYYRRPGETLFAVADRLPAVFKRQDPQLQSAPILGWNSLQQCAIYAGQIAVALDRQIDFVADLIDQPRVYKEELRLALARYPELEPAVTYFREMMDPNSGALRERRTGSFRSKLLPLLADPTMLARFAAPRAGVDLDESIRNKGLVLFDQQYEQDPERRQFGMTWSFRYVIDFVKHRGMAGRGQEFFFIIDEITALLGQRSGDGTSILAEDLEELVAVLGRNYGVNVVLAHQNLSQVDERIRNILMQCGTQIIGNITNPDDRLYLARQFFRYRPFWRKKQEPVWMGVSQLDTYGLPLGYSAPQVIDTRNVEYTPEEQLLLSMEKFALPRFQFLVRPATAEGMISQKLYRLSIERLDAGQYPDVQAVSQILAYLRQKDGTPIETLLTEIRSRRKTGPLESATMKSNAHAVPLPTPIQDDDEDILREEA